MIYLITVRVLKLSSYRVVSNKKNNQPNQFSYKYFDKLMSRCEILIFLREPVVIYRCSLSHNLRHRFDSH